MLWWTPSNCVAIEWDYQGIITIDLIKENQKLIQILSPKLYSCRKTILTMKVTSFYGIFMFSLCNSTLLILKQKKTFVGENNTSSLKILLLDNCYLGVNKYPLICSLNENQNEFWFLSSIFFFFFNNLWFFNTIQQVWK